MWQTVKNGCLTSLQKWLNHDFCSTAASPSPPASLATVLTTFQCDIFFSSCCFYVYLLKLLWFSVDFTSFCSSALLWWVEPLSLLFWQSNVACVFVSNHALFLCVCVRVCVVYSIKSLARFCYCRHCFKPLMPSTMPNWSSVAMLHYTPAGRASVKSFSTAHIVILIDE